MPALGVEVVGDLLPGGRVGLAGKRAVAVEVVTSPVSTLRYSPGLTIVPGAKRTS